MRRPRLRPPLRPLRRQRRRMVRQRQRAAGSRPRANATRSTRPTRRRSGHRARRSVSLSLLAVPATRPFRREPPQRRQRPLSRAPYSRGNSQPLRPQRPRLRPRHMLLPQRPPAMARRCAKWRGGVHVRAASALPLPVRYGRLGQHEIPRLPFRRDRELRPYEAGRVHVRGRRQGGWRSGRHERKASLTLRPIGPPPLIRRGPHAPH